MSRRAQPPLLTSLGRSQIASLTATLIDFTTLILLVEAGHMGYLPATFIGASCGALVNFFLGRHWSFEADGEAVRGQATRYALVSALSLVLNSAGVYLLTEFIGIHYAISRAISAVLVGLLFNFPLHRRFVFRRHHYAR